MPTFDFEMEDGRKGTFEAKDETDASAQLKIVKADMMSQPMPPKAAPAPKPPAMAPEPAYDPAGGMNPLEKFGVGLTGGVKSALTGVGDLVGLASPEAVEERKEWDKSKGHLGNWGTAGELVGEAGITAPVGGPIGAAGKVLTKTIPALGKLAAKGGKYLNLGNITNAATQGAVSGGLVGEAKDKTLMDRADDVAAGFGLGGAAPLVLKVAALPIRLTYRVGKGALSMLSPSATVLEKKTYNALKEVLGEERMTNIYRAMTDEVPPSIPLTPAAMTGDPVLGAVERGGRLRGHADYASSDEATAREAEGVLNSISPSHSTQAGDDLRTKFRLNGEVMTRKSFGRRPDEVPDIQGHVLRQTLGKMSPHLSDVERDVFGNLASELSRHDAARFGTTVTPDASGGSDVISATLALLSAVKGSPTIWKIRSAFNTAASHTADKTLKNIDEVVKDPQKFMTLVENLHEGLQQGRPLRPGEELLQRTITEMALASGRTAAVHTPDQRTRQRY